MKKLLILLLLTSCATQPKIETVTEVQRIVVKPPAQLLEIPPYDMPLDVDHATQRSIAEWILKTETRMQRLEDQIKAIRKWSEELK